MSKNVCHSFLRPPLDAGFHIPMHRTQQTQQQPTQVTRKGCSDRRKKGRDGRIIKKGIHASSAIASPPIPRQLLFLLRRAARDRSERKEMERARRADVTRHERFFFVREDGGGTVQHKEGKCARGRPIARASLKANEKTNAEERRKTSPRWFGRRVQMLSLKPSPSSHLSGLSLLLSEERKKGRYFMNRLSARSDQLRARSVV